MVATVMGNGSNEGNPGEHRPKERHEVYDYEETVLGTYREALINAQCPERNG